MSSIVLLTPVPQGGGDVGPPAGLLDLPRAAAGAPRQARPGGRSLGPHLRRGRGQRLPADWQPRHHREVAVLSLCVNCVSMYWQLTVVLILSAVSKRLYCMLNVGIVGDGPSISLYVQSQVWLQSCLQPLTSVLPKVHCGRGQVGRHEGEAERGEGARQRGPGGAVASAWGGRLSWLIVDNWRRL